jgi:hypothetical protein
MLVSQFFAKSFVVRSFYSTNLGGVNFNILGGGIGPRPY